MILSFTLSVYSLTAFSVGIAASLAPEAVAAFDVEHAAMLADDFPDDPLAVHHRVFCVLATPP